VQKKYSQQKSKGSHINLTLAFSRFSILSVAFLFILLLYFVFYFAPIKGAF